MIGNKTTFFSLLALFFMGLTAHSQVITSKQEAKKKGVYTTQVSSKTTAATAETKKSSSKSNSSSNTAILKKLKTENESDIFAFEDNYLASQMINNAMNFLGTRYRTGGTTIAGMDCSGMVTAVFNIFERTLPRSSRDMAKMGTEIKRESARTGDLIFFRTNGSRNINHVGLIVSVEGDEIKFIHSSTSRGVVISSTEEAYYKKSFAQINRVL